MEHMLWTAAGYGPVEDMLAPGKKLLLMECGTVSMDGISTHGSNTLSDAYVTDTGTVQTIVELPLDLLKDDYIAQQREYLAKNPNNMELKQIVTSMEQLHQRLEQASSVELTIPYTVTTYTDDDEKLYQNGVLGKSVLPAFARNGGAGGVYAPDYPSGRGSRRGCFCPAGATDSPGILIRKLRGLR